MVTSHSVTLSGLVPGMTYHYRVRSTDTNGQVLTSSDFSFATPAVSLFVPQLRLVPDEYTGLAMANLDQSSATLSLLAFAGDGTQLNGSGITNPATTILKPGTQLPVIVDQLLSPNPISWPTGWAAINSSTANLDGFFLTFNSELTLMDGAPLSSSLLDSFIFPESLSQDYTNVVLANPNGGAASVNIDVVKQDGTVRSTFQTGIPAFATYAADLQKEIFPGVTVDPSDYLRVASSTPLVPYEFFGNISRDLAILAGQDTKGGATTLYAPQYAVGGAYDSSLSIVTLDPIAGTVTLKLLGGDGVQIGATKILPIAGNGKIYISDPSFFLGALPTQLTTGYIQVVSDGVRLSGDEVFSDALHGTFSTALPLISALQNSESLSHIASDATYFTGLAILNPNAADATITIQIYTASGQLDKSLTLVLPANNRLSRLLTEFFPDLAGQSRLSGYIKVTADQGIACYGIFGTNNLSVLSAIPTQAAP